MRFLVCFWTNPLDRTPSNTPGFLRTVIYTDILRRLFLCADIPTEWAILILDETEGEIQASNNWVDFCSEYHLLSVPSRVVRSLKDLHAASSQIVIFSPELLPVLTVVGQTNTKHPIRQLLSKQTVLFRPIEIVQAEGKPHRNFPAGLGPEALRMFLTFALSNETTMGAVALQSSVRLGKEIDKALQEGKPLPWRMDVSEDPPSVMRGGFHYAVERFSKIDSTKIDARTAGERTFRALEIYGRYLPLLEDEAGKDDFNRFREAVRFCFFPRALDKNKKEGIRWPCVKLDLVAFWKKEHRVTLPVQVDGKIRGRIVVKAWEMEEMDRIVSIALALPSIRKWLGEKEPASIHFKKGEILSFQSAAAKIKRRE